MNGYSSQGNFASTISTKTMSTHLYLGYFSSMMLLKTSLGFFVSIMLVPWIIMCEIGISCRPGRRCCCSCSGGGCGCRSSSSFLLRKMDSNLNITKLFLFTQMFYFCFAKLNGRIKGQKVNC